mmetsp:Transcript_22397/g.53012  ORF Transcript_22397/g.53012 Transcript_22397/m.53012 type:complete len:80 (-) Transcript_22397:580-819(-)
MISSADTMVLNRCAMTRVERPCVTADKAPWICRSVTVSRALVASSRMTIRGFLSKVRAMATRCFSPPLSLNPRSPTRVS